MARDPDSTDYASIKLTHHATTRDREETIRKRPGRRSSRPECLVIGHAWTEDPTREGGTLCMVCQVIRFP